MWRIKQILLAAAVMLLVWSFLRALICGVTGAVRRAPHLLENQQFQSVLCRFFHARLLGKVQIRNAV